MYLSVSGAHVKPLALAWSLAGTSWQLLPRNAVLGTRFAGVLAR